MCIQMIGQQANNDLFSNLKKYISVKIFLPLITFISLFVITILAYTDKSVQNFFSTIAQNYAILLESLGNPLIERSIIASIIVGTICAIVGVFVLLRGLVFLGEAVTHSAFAGVTFGLLFAIEPIYTTILFAVFGVLLVGYVNEKQVMND